MVRSEVDRVCQAYLITLSDGHDVVARVARQFMPRLKTESEVATMHYLREHTSVPVPIVYHYDSNPYNRLGGEYILMSKVCSLMQRVL
jgi:aminoglycoside phosphotransferase (APT) family kinase protein